MKKLWGFLLWLALVGLLTACAPAATSTPAPTFGGAAPAAPRSAEATPAPPQSGANGTLRLVIKNADLTIQVDEPKAALAAITQIADAMGGYVVSAKSYQITRNGVEVSDAVASLRVDAARLDAALAAIRALVPDPGKDVTAENISGEDVTADYVDLRSRLVNLESTEKQLQRIQEGATKTEDVLTVFKQLSEVRGQIEQVKGKMKYYEEAAALSSINVTILAKVSIAPVSDSGWQPARTLRDAFQALINLGQGLVNLLIWLMVVFLPFGLVLYLPGRWLVRAYRKAQPRPPSPKAGAQ